MSLQESYHACFSRRQNSDKLPAAAHVPSATLLPMCMILCSCSCVRPPGAAHRHCSLLPPPCTLLCCCPFAKLFAAALLHSSLLLPA